MRNHLPAKSLPLHHNLPGCACSSPLCSLCGVAEGSYKHILEDCDEVEEILQEDGLRTDISLMSRVLTTGKMEVAVIKLRALRTALSITVASCEDRVARVKAEIRLSLDRLKFAKTKSKNHPKHWKKMTTPMS